MAPVISRIDVIKPLKHFTIIKKPGDNGGDAPVDDPAGSTQ